MKNKLIPPVSPTGTPRLPGTRSFQKGLLAICSALALTTSVFGAANLGTGRLFSVTPNDGGCVKDTKNNVNSVEAWDVQQGKSYHITLTDVTECSSPTIGVIVKSSDNGNQCLTATKTGTGQYEFDVTLPLTACNTMPIVYCVSNCDPSTGKFAIRSDGILKQSHLRAATFGDNCSNPTADTNCNADQNCTISVTVNSPGVCDKGGGLPAILTATVLGAVGNVTYTWTQDGGITFGTQSGNTIEASAAVAGDLSYTFHVTVEDANHCKSSADGTLNVYDCTGQGCAIVCPGNVTIQCGESTDPDVNENLGKAHCVGTACNLSHSDSFEPACGNSGTITRTWICTDSDTGLSSTCTQTITIEDHTAPTISCPENVTIECGADESPKNTGVATATDECSNCINVSIYSGTTQGDGTFTVGTTGGGADYTGLVGSFTTANIAFTSWHPFGQASFGADITGNLNVAADGDYTFALESDDGSLLFIDGNPVVNNGNAHGPGTATGTATLTAGLHTFEIQFFECCGGPSELNLTLPYGVTYANCVQVGYEDSVTEGECLDKVVKTITRTWTAVDACGNVSEPCIQTITVKDTTGPELHGCPDPDGGTVECFGDLPPVPTVTATDDCDKNVQVSYVQTPGTSSCQTVTRTWTATDSCGNTTTCTQTIKVDDKTPPDLTVPGDLTVECDKVPDPGTASASDKCDPDPKVEYLGEERTDGNCPSNYTLTRTWRATDACGNPIEKSQTITVHDTTAPTLTVPDDATVECDAVPAPGEATATDNCDQNPAVEYLGEDRTDGNCANNYTLTRTWRATDACGNPVEKSQTITVQDTTAPTLTIPKDVTVECGSSTKPEDTGFGTATDACSGCMTVDIYTGFGIAGGGAPYSGTKKSFKTSGISFVDWHPFGLGEFGADINGVLIVSAENDYTFGLHSDDGSVLYIDGVLVVDNGGPHGPEDQDGLIHLSAGSHKFEVQFFECCGGPSELQLTLPEGVTYGNGCISYSDSFAAACGNTGTITRTWTATDVCGNTKSLDQTIRIVDTTKPVVTCPGNIGPLNHDAGTCCAKVPFSAQVQDCDTTPVVVYKVGNTVIESGKYCFPVGTTTVTVVATDACNNASDPCTFTVTVLGTICGYKYYDANNNGPDAADTTVIPGWKVQLWNSTGTTKLDEQLTDAAGKYKFNVAAGNYIVKEVLPSGSWVAKSATSVGVSVTSSACDAKANFYNNCQPTPGGHTLGFWSNKNGQALETAADFAQLTTFNLRNANGSNHDFPAANTAALLASDKTDLSNWLTGANASNMANMLSAQMTATYLSTQHGFTTSSIIVDGTRDVAAEIAYANSLLAYPIVGGTFNGQNGSVTINASALRTEQERVKNILDAINNGKSFVQPSPCAFSY